MNAILILLGLFSLTLIFSQSSFLKKANAFSFLSVPLLIGYAFSDEGLIPFLPSTKENLMWALRVALLWMALMSGVRVSEQARKWRAWLSLVPFVLGYLFFLELTIIGLRIFGASSDVVLSWDNLNGYLLSQQFSMAVILSAAIFSSKENPFLLVLVAGSLWFFHEDPSLEFRMKDFLSPLAVGGILALVFRLIAGTHLRLELASRLTLLGLCILGAGWALGMGSLEVLVGLAFGVGLALMINKRNFLSDPVLVATEVPVRLIVSFFAGLELSLSPAVLQVGALLAVARMLIKWSLLKIGLRSAQPEVILSQILPISHFALPLVLCLHLSLRLGNASRFMLSVFAVAFVVNDLVNLAVEYWRRELKVKTVVAQHE